MYHVYLKIMKMLNAYHLQMTMLYQFGSTNDQIDPMNIFVSQFWKTIFTPDVNTCSDMGFLFSINGKEQLVEKTTIYVYVFIFVCA